MDGWMATKERAFSDEMFLFPISPIFCHGYEEWQ